MPCKGNVRKVFPGGNTCCGFHSFYNYILPQYEASRIFVIKGGPGVGKSTFMKKIGDDLQSRGFDIEYEQCSSDNDSLDGILIPALKIALIDGTAPHVVDPKNPGAVDEIINLGEYWNDSKMVSMRDEILKVNIRVGKHFETAYSLLKEAKVAYDEWKGYIKESMDRSKYNELLKQFLDNIFKGSISQNSTLSGERHLFASAITPEGLKSYVDTLIIPGMKVYALQGGPGSGVHEMIARAAQASQELNLFTEQFHCPFEPDYINMVIIPQINAIVLNTSAPFGYSIDKYHGIVVTESINLDICIKGSILENYQSELEDARMRFYSLLDKAISHISQAKALHDTLEKYYVCSMDFKSIDQKREETLKRILEYIK